MARAVYHEHRGLADVCRIGSLGCPALVRLDADEEVDGGLNPVY